MLSRRLVRHVLLALLLVVTQQQALLHVLGHALGPASAQAAGPVAEGPAAADHDALCVQCLAFAQLDHTPAPQAMPAPATPARFELAAAPAVAGHAPRLQTDYLSRAPPRA